MTNNNFIQSRAWGFLHNHWTENIPSADFQDKVLNIPVNTSINSLNCKFGETKKYTTRPTNPWATDNDIKKPY